MNRMRTGYKQEMRLLQGRARIIWAVVLVAFLIYLPTILENRAAFGYYFTETQLLGVGLPQINFALVAIMAAVALNLLVGYTGLLSMGHAAFFAVGAIVSSVLGVQNDLPFPLIVLLAGVVGAGVGALVGLPSLRVRGLYLLLSTLALHFIAAYVFLQYQEKNFGPSGINFNPPSLFGWILDSDRRWYFVLVVLCGIVLLLSRNLLHMRQGRAMVAIRDHEVAAGSLGIAVGAHRIKAFAMTSFFTSAAGALYVYYLGNTSSDVYTLEFVINYFAIIIIGGMGSLLGAVLGAILWQLLPQALTTLSQSVDPATPVLGDLLGQYQGQTVSLILGLLVILIMIFRPAGLAGVWLAVKRGVTRWPYSS
jgi:branched-chain amino acid transport system permease protein